ncbi:MAG TPA: maleylpyruvate isomerase family mycothiol-dependent enzyme [Acidimicrobiales bacterium]|nr:maleylpyruvate isomerase family mycothiol-dependent enzyme [Acidimicrobiales bacterium]
MRSRRSVDPTAPEKLPYSDYVDAVAANASGLAAVLRGGPATSPVPSCPAWSLAELGAHAGDFASFYAHRICDATGAPRPPWPDTWRHGGASPLIGVAAATYFDDRAQFLVALLRATSPDAAVRTWKEDDQTAHFVARRSAHELAVHRVDAQLATGEAAPIDAELAADGIEEIFMMLDVFKKRDARRVGGTAASLALHPTDGPRRWVVVLDGDAASVERRPGPADLSLTGTTSDLELLLYGRPVAEDVRRDGDHEALEAWYRVFSFT